jgi:hypothetical protein
MPPALHRLERSSVSPPLSSARPGVDWRQALMKIHGNLGKAVLLLLIFPLISHQQDQRYHSTCRRGIGPWSHKSIFLPFCCHQAFSFICQQRIHQREPQPLSSPCKPSTFSNGFALFSYYSSTTRSTSVFCITLATSSFDPLRPELPVFHLLRPRRETGSEVTTSSRLPDYQSHWSSKHHHITC